MPCALYHNFTGIDIYLKLSLQPWMIALLLLKIIVHEKSLFWCQTFMIANVGKGGNKGLSSEE
jgi:hypothetical protein